MTYKLIPFQLTPEQQGQIFGILSVGCDRETAANFIGCTPADIGRAMRQDTNFATSVRRTEATAELAHMRTVHEAAKDPKNWRAAVWWLECRSPERFGPRGGDTITSRHLKSFVQLLSDHLNEDIHNPEDRDRVLARFKQIQIHADQLSDDLFQTHSEFLEPPFQNSSTKSDLARDESSDLDTPDTEPQGFQWT